MVDTRVDPIKFVKSASNSLATLMVLISTVLKCWWIDFTLRKEKSLRCLTWNFIVTEE